MRKLIHVRQRGSVTALILCIGAAAVAGGQQLGEQVGPPQFTGGIQGELNAPLDRRLLSNLSPGMQQVVTATRRTSCA